MYATLAEESFAPIINRSSKHMAASIDPIHERQVQEQQRRRDRMAQLAADVEQDRRREETFAPKTSALPAGMSLDHRVPLADRSNRPRESTEGGSPLSNVSPQVNAKSEAMVSGGARQHIEEAQKLRKQVQELWAANSDGAGSMDRRGAIQCLRSMGVQSNSTTHKFLLALGFVNGDDVPRSEHVLQVDYDRFQKVLTAVLKAASAAAASMLSAEQHRDSRASSSSQPRFDGRQQSTPQHKHSPSPHVGRSVPSDRRSSQSPQGSRSVSPTTIIEISKDPSTSKVVRVDHSVRKKPLPQNSRSPSQSTVESMQSSQPPTPQYRSRGGIRDSHVPPRIVQQQQPVGSARKQQQLQQPQAQKRSNAVYNEVPFTFTPSINTDVVPKQRGPIQRPAMRQETRERIEALRDQQHEAETGQCTFRPKTTEWQPSMFRHVAASRSEERTEDGSESATPSPRYRAARPHVQTGTNRNSTVPVDKRNAQGGGRRGEKTQFEDSPSAEWGKSARTVSIGHDDSADIEEWNEDRDANHSSQHNERLEKPVHHGGHQRNKPQHHPTRSSAMPERRSGSASTAPSMSASVEGASSVAASMLGVTPGFEAAVRRMRKARAEHQPSFEEGLRRSSTANRTRSISSRGKALPPQCLRHVDPQSLSPAPQDKRGVSAVSESPKTTTEVEPFHFRTDERNLEREHAKPLLFVDVDLPHGRTGRIGVHRGDTAHELALHFCATYSLDEGTMYRLTDILQEKIDSVVEERTRSLWL